MSQPNGGDRARVDRLLAQAIAGTSAALVIRGEPGIGKTTLLRYAREAADGMAALEVGGVETEAEIPFAALSDLLRPLLARLEEIPAPQASALAGALALAPPATVDRFAVGAATLSLLASAAEEAPLLVLVDDAQWVDAASAEALLFAARRLGEEGIVLLFALRDGEPAAFDPAGLAELTLSGLEREASDGLLNQGGRRMVEREVARRLFEATRGNPLALVEISNLLSAAQLEGREPLEEPLPSGEGMRHAFLRRVAALPAETQRALLVAAASDSPDLGVIVAAADRLGLDQRAFDPAEAAGLVAMRDHGLEWRHPLVRSAVYHGASPFDRRRAHRALGETLNEERHADRRTWHLAAGATAPDERVARALERAALRAGARGGPVGAAAAWERAALFTPREDLRARRMLEAARGYVLAGRLPRAAGLLEDASSVSADPLVRADVQHLRARIALWREEPLTAYRLLVAEASRVEGVDHARAVSLLADAARAASLAGDIPLELETALRAHAVAAGGGRDERLVSGAALGRALALSGDRDAARSALAECAAMLEDCDPLAFAFVGQLVSEGSIWIEEYPQARLILERGIDAARAVGAVGVLPQALANLSELDFRVGRFAAAYAGASESLALAESLGEAGEATFSRVCLAQVEAAQGRESDCRAHSDAAIARAQSAEADTGFVYGHYSLGLLELGLGRPANAIPHLETVARFVAEHGLEDPGVLQWGADLVEAYVLSGRGSDAEGAYTRLERQAERTGSPWALAVAARCRGFLAGEHFVADFEEALQWHLRTPSSFERARTELRFGERLRRARRIVEARARLHTALDTFERLDAEPWAAQARVELAATGERVRQRRSPGLGGLTPQELQISLLVAQGSTNRETAAALFLSAKTIEFHLAKVYRKLGVRSRTELTRLLARDGSDTADPVVPTRLG